MRALPIKEELQISGGFCLTMAVMLLVLPLDWLLAMAAAGFVHELAHILAVWLLGGRILSCRISAGGAVIGTSPMESVRQLLCILAGPLGGLALLPLARFLPKLAVCAFVQSAYNLLPLFPLDGGRALGCLLELAAGSEKGERIFLVVQRVVSVLLAVLGIVCAVSLRLGLLPLLMLIALWGGGKLQKIKNSLQTAA